MRIGITLSVICVLFFASRVTTVQSIPPVQGSEPEKLALKLQLQVSPSFQVESDQELKRAIVVARKRKTNVGTLFTGYLMLTNVASEGCDLSRPAITSDSDFALLFLISESVKEKEGPGKTSIHRTLFETDQTQPAYVFVATLTDRESLEKILGDVPYHAEPAWPIGWGSRWRVTVIPKGTENKTPLEVRLENSASGWTSFLQHISAKKQRYVLGANGTTFLVLSRSANGPSLRFQHREKKVSVAGNVPLTVCGLIPEDAPMPFGLGS